MNQQRRSYFHRILGQHTIILGLMVMIGCSGQRIGHQAPSIQQLNQQLEESDDLKSPIKVFRIDGTIILFGNGARVNDKAIWGTADVMSPDGTLDTGVVTTVTASEIAGATLYEFKQSAGSVIGAAVTGVAGAASWLMAVICVTNPKSCFGSCPTVYVPYADSMVMVAELFSTSISPSLARSDLDRLCTVDGDAPIPVYVTNEALESHYIDQLQFVYVPHDPDETALPQPDGSIGIGCRYTLESTTRSVLDEDLTTLLSASDEAAWRSGPTRLLTVSADDPFDHVDVTVHASNAPEIDLRLRWKNTLLSTVLFYNMVLGDQGLHALSWQHLLDTDPLYSRAFSSIYDRYSGIRVLVWDGGKWDQQAVLTDAGPIVWREESVRLSTFGQDTIRIRLKGLADNIEIDAVEASIPVQTVAQEIAVPWTVTSTSVPKLLNTPDVLAEADTTYLLHEPGESTELVVQPPSNARYGTLFVRSHGWYYEWVRQQWIGSGTRLQPYKLLGGKRMIEELGRRWMDEHQAIESSFHKATIPLRKP